MPVRRLELRDVEAVIALQSACPEAAQWRASDYERAARGEMACWVAESEAGIAGFLVAQRLVQENEVLNLAVRTDARRRGIGAQLLEQAIDWSRRCGAEKLILEVRASNLVALRFYERHGFDVVGRRPHYYVDPVEEALLLSIGITGGSVASR